MEESGTEMEENRTKTKESGASRKKKTDLGKKLRGKGSGNFENLKN